MDGIFYFGVSALFGAMGVRAVAQAIQRNIEWVREDYDERAGLNEWRREAQAIEKLKREDPHDSDNTPTIRRDKDFAYIHFPPCRAPKEGPNGEEKTAIDFTAGYPFNDPDYLPIATKDDVVYKPSEFLFACYRARVRAILSEMQAALKQRDEVVRSNSDESEVAQKIIEIFKSADDFIASRQPSAT